MSGETSTSKTTLGEVTACEATLNALIATLTSRRTPPTSSFAQHIVLNAFPSMHSKMSHHWTYALGTLLLFHPCTHTQVTRATYVKSASTLVTATQALNGHNPLGVYHFLHCN